MKVTRDTIEQLAWYAVLLVLVATAAVFAISYNLNRQVRSQNQQLQKQAEQITNNGQGIIVYLDCIGHIKTPVAQRTQADYDVCLDLMRKQVRGD